jgi:hypothetical protein
VCRTTSNYAEQENARFKQLGLRAMPPLDFVDGVCQVVSNVATKSSQTLPLTLIMSPNPACNKVSCSLLTEYAQGLLRESHAKAT